MSDWNAAANFMGVSMPSQRKLKCRAPASRTTAVHSPAKSIREAALETRVGELEEQLQARDDFLALAAHELRNPMTPISAQVELLLAKAPENTRSAPAGLVQGLKRLETLVDAYLRRATLLLEVCRVRSGNLRLQIEEVDLSALVRKVTSNLTPLAERAGCSIHLTLEEGIVARCDAMATEQVLENLLSNAVRYGPGHPIAVTAAKDRDVARLSVRDEGVGIAEPDQSQIFEPFRTVRRSSSNGGFGVGLWVTQRLVNAMQGKIAVSSTPGAGSTFAVKLPVARA
jgi:two-component system OmpR family sensor kinase